jgi:hypothetical protein
VSQSIINSITSQTGDTYNCLNVFGNPEPNWAAWVAPWMFSTPSQGWDSWLSSNSAHQVIVGMDLIPQSISNTSNPLAWEAPCASGAYNQYATTLATNLVSYGAGSVVIRLGVEANGSWEADYVGSTTTEMSDWGKCFANEVTAMNKVAGTHFLFVWNPNICTANLPLSSWYPGNPYVNIIGADAYDVDCDTNQSVGQEGWATYYTDNSNGNVRAASYPSLSNIEAFAHAHGKAMAFPEWGLTAGDDDPAYVNGLSAMFNSDDFAYQSYYDDGDSGIAQLGSSIPKSTTAAKAFK